MKLKTMMVALVSFLLTMAACAQTQLNKESDSENMDKGKKVLVAYFSATGTTKAVAKDFIPEYVNRNCRCNRRRPD